MHVIMYEYMYVCVYLYGYMHVCVYVCVYVVVEQLMNIGGIIAWNKDHPDKAVQRRHHYLC